MIDLNTKYLGHISRVDKQRGFGFIELPDQESFISSAKMRRGLCALAFCAAPSLYIQNKTSF